MQLLFNDNILHLDVIIMTRPFLFSSVFVSARDRDEDLRLTSADYLKL